LTEPASNLGIEDLRKLRDACDELLLVHRDREVEHPAIPVLREKRREFDQRLREAESHSDLA
jgi:hypothetical protein